MIRSSFLSCVLLTIFNFALALAQESPSTETPFPPASLKATPEILALIAESHQLLEQLPEEERAMALFQVLELQFLFADKQPARKTIQEILALIPSIEKDSVRTQICEATAVILAELGDFGQCVQTLNQITKPVDRAEKQLNVAEQILNNAEMTKTPISFDMTGLLQSALTGAVEAKDKGLESLVSIVLARELAKQGKIEESKILFESARKKAREIEEIEEQNLIGFMVRSMIGVGMQPEAMAMIETVTEEDAKRLLMGQAAVAMAQEGKTKDAGVLVKTFKPGDMKDNVLVRVAETAAKTITVEQILELAKQTASPESREKFLERTFLALLENKRDDAASELAGHSENAPEYQKRLQLWQLESLIDEKKFAEAEKNIATLSPDSATFPPELKQSLLRQLILIEIQAKGLSNELLNRLTATFSEEDEKNRALLQAEAEKAAKMDDFNESMLSLEQIIQSQIQMLDLQSAAKTFRLLFEIAAKSTDPSQTVFIRLNIATIQAQLNDKAGVKENLGQLLSFLDGIKDVMTLKGLIQDKPVDAETESTQPVLKLKPPVDEAAVKNVLFEVYASITMLLQQVGEEDKVKISFQKAKQLADSEPDTRIKFAKLLNFAQILARSQQNK